MKETREAHYRGAKCKIEGCDQTARKLWMCLKHYKRVLVHGDPNHKKIKTKDLSGQRL